VFGLVSAIYGDVAGIGMTYGYSCLCIAYSGRNKSNKEIRIKSTCKKERRKKRKEDIYEENRTV
jgi:hypothetical protein